MCKNNTMGNAIDKAIQMHKDRYPGSEVLKAGVISLGSLWSVELDCEHFSTHLIYTVFKSEVIE